MKAIKAMKRVKAMKTPARKNLVPPAEKQRLEASGEVKKHILYKYTERRTGTDQWQARKRREEAKKTAVATQIETLEKEVAEAKKRLERDALEKAGEWTEIEELKEKVKKALEENDELKQKFDGKRGWSFEEILQNSEFIEKMSYESADFGMASVGDIDDDENGDGGWEKKGRRDAFRLMETHGGEDPWRKNCRTWGKGVLDGIESWHNMRRAQDEEDEEEGLVEDEEEEVADAEMEEEWRMWRMRRRGLEQKQKVEAEGGSKRWKQCVLLKEPEKINL